MHVKLSFPFNIVPSEVEKLVWFSYIYNLQTEKQRENKGKIDTEREEDWYKERTRERKRKQLF